MYSSFVHTAAAIAPSRRPSVSWIAPSILIGIGLAACGSASAQVLRFGRTTDTIEVPLQTSLTSQATFEARIRIPVGGTPVGTIYHEQANAAEDKSLYVGNNFARGIAFTLEGNYINRPTVPGTPPTLADGLWHHVAFVRDGNEERFYLDGVRVYSIAWSPLIANSSASGPIAIGAGQFDYYMGAPLISVDWLRLSSVARYAGAGALPPACEPASDAGTLALFLFNDAPGSTIVIDSGPAGANGTVARGFSSATAPLFETDPSQNGKPSFTQPSSQTACLQGSASFSVTAVGPGALDYQWRRNGAPINTIVHPSAATATLTLTNIGPADAATYDCIVTNACGSVTSNDARLAFCPADFNGDCFLDFFDYDDYVNCFETGTCGDGTADFNGDEFVDFFDYDDFVAAFEAGC